MTLKPRREVESLGPVVHGGVNEAELEALGIGPEELLDFSTGINPLGPPPAVRTALQDVPIERYPDPSAIRLRRAIGAVLGVSPDEVLLGNGASELIMLVALAYFRHRQRVMILGPTYGEYERVTRLMGARPVVVPRDVEDPTAWDPVAVDRTLADSRPHVVFICNPNNPTGHRFGDSDIRRWVRRYPDTLFVIDESYAGLAGGPDFLRQAQPPPANLIVVRSLTKDYGLAGLRLGYAVASAPVIARLGRCQTPWSVNVAAQVAGLVVFTDPTVPIWLRQAVRRLWRFSDSLRRALVSAGFRVLPTATPFFLVHVGNATQVRQALLRDHRILVRDCTSFGLPAWIRVMPGLQEANLRLVRALMEVREWTREPPAVGT